MLDLLRRHASSWLNKLILLLIVGSFAFFFGYNQLENQARLGAETVARVGSIIIPRRKFDLHLQESLKQLSQSPEEKLPPQLEKLVRENLLNQLVRQEIAALFAESIGLDLTDPFLAREIQKQKTLFPDGDFNFETYKQFLENYQRHLGEDFESSFRRQLLTSQLYRLADSAFGPWQRYLQKQAPETQTASPNMIVARWLDQFREKTEIELH